MDEKINRGHPVFDILAHVILDNLYTCDTTGKIIK